MIADNYLWIDGDELTKKQRNRLIKNCKFIREDGALVTVYRLTPDGGLQLPRGAWAFVPDTIEYHDERSFPRLPKLESTVELDAILPDGRVYEGQNDALQAIYEHEQGLVIRPPGTGKTQIALKFIAGVGTRSLVIVHTEDILEQWHGYTEAVIPELEGNIGIIRGKSQTIGHMTIAMLQTITENNYPEEWWRQWGAVIFDEAHHVAAPSWEVAANQCTARYRVGFTATETRADGMHPLMPLIIGPVIYELPFKSAVPVHVQRVNTKFDFWMRHRRDWANLINALVSDQQRNELIAEITDEQLSEGHSTLVLSRRIDHLENISELIEGPHEILAAKLLRKPERKALVNDFRRGKIKCVLATQLADEALDVPILSRVLLTFPGKHDGRLVQQAGRALRQHEGKDEAIIYDFVDKRQDILNHQWHQRRTWYRKAGMKIKRRK